MLFELSLFIQAEEPGPEMLLTIQECLRGHLVQLEGVIAVEIDARHPPTVAPHPHFSSLNHRAAPDV